MSDVIHLHCKGEDKDEDVENLEYALVVSLLSHLECPVCYEISEPPIYSCRNGHNVCHICQKQMKECATCRAPGQPNIRNRFAEHTHATLTVPCENVDRGCTARTLPHRRFEHALQCDHAPLGCVVCDFTGTPAGLVEHVRSEHPEIEQINLPSQSSHSSRKVSLETFDRMSTIVRGGALFWLYERYSAAGNSFTFQLFKCGPGSAQESDYYCHFRFTTDDVQEELSFRYPIPYAAEVSCENDRAVTGNTLNLLAREGTLHYCMTISHSDEEKERIESKIQRATSGLIEEDTQVDTIYFFMMPLVFFFVVGCFKGWWQALLSWH